jgi:hypothetical protein
VARPMPASAPVISTVGAGVLLLRFMVYLLAVGGCEIDGCDSMGVNVGVCGPFR